MPLAQKGSGTKAWDRCPCPKKNEREREREFTHKLFFNQITWRDCKVSPNEEHQSLPLSEEWAKFGNYCVSWQGDRALHCYGHHPIILLVHSEPTLSPPSLPFCLHHAIIRNSGGCLMFGRRLSKIFWGKWDTVLEQVQEIQPRFLFRLWVKP